MQPLSTHLLSTHLLAAAAFSVPPDSTGRHSPSDFLSAPSAQVILHAAMAPSPCAVQFCYHMVLAVCRGRGSTSTHDRRYMLLHTSAARVATGDVPKCVWWLVLGANILHSEEHLLASPTKQLRRGRYSLLYYYCRAAGRATEVLELFLFLSTNYQTYLAGGDGACIKRGRGLRALRSYGDPRNFHLARTAGAFAPRLSDRVRRSRGRARPACECARA